MKKLIEQGYPTLSSHMKVLGRKVMAFMSANYCTQRVTHRKTRLLSTDIGPTLERNFQTGRSVR